ncbi:MAG TPA: hypothetical protein DCW29_08140 [Janthinobacterium sp.]|nr:hypothetical protein [Janthinobacterium sp.]
MDLLTSAIVSAVEQSTRVLARLLLASSFARLKNLIANKFVNGDLILEAIANLELDPGSVSRRQQLSEQLSAANAGADGEVLEAARTLLKDAQPPRTIPAVPPGYKLYELASEPAEVEANYAVVKVYFATDRNGCDGKPPAGHFGNERAPLSYGSCNVSIPRDHRMGALESPSLWRLEFRRDPALHVVLLDVAVQDKDAYFTELSARIQASARKNAFLFVHGYNVSFEDAARRCGQMCYDLGFDGAPVFYSWPSQGTLSGYLVDEANIEWSQSNLTVFLIDFLGRTGAQNVYVIGHSMGNRALARAVADVLARFPALAGKLTEIILTAPDIDAAVFRRDIAPALAGASHPVTLYASSEDRALAASRKVHGAPRAGDSGAALLVMDRVETIDATGVDTSLLKHSYFAEKSSALSDMFYLINNDARPDQRFLQRVSAGPGWYWAFKK